MEVDMRFGRYLVALQLIGVSMTMSATLAIAQLAEQPGVGSIDPKARPLAEAAAQLRDADGRYKKVVVDPARDLKITTRGDFTIAAVGDIVAARPTAGLAEPDVRAIYDVLRNADVAFGNLEMVVMDPRKADGLHSRALYFMALGKPEIADDLKAIGFDIVNRANNHTTTWGVEGMRETTAQLERVGIVGAGAGENKVEAQRPGYFESSKGRVAILGITSTSDLDARPAGDISAGSPGANALHMKRRITISRQAFDSLAAAYAAAPYMFPGFAPITSGSMSSEARPEQIRIYDNTYVIGDKASFDYDFTPGELSDYAREVRNAKYSADFVVANIHAHQWQIPEGAKSAQAKATTPPDFLKTLAHTAIDNGASVFYAHGEGEVRGIEIYKGRPIFYQLGMFTRQPFLPQHWEADLWAATTRFVPGYQPDMKDVVTLTEAAGGIYPAAHNREYFESIVPVSRYRDGRLTEILIYPVDMKFDGPFYDIGVPRLARGAAAQRILERVRARSQEFGTRIQIRGGIGVIRL
jgi:poly-gamma-glutamate capsule biosynthesis protein CapA/YwtB (metallophosphatase superfamily)